MRNHFWQNPFFFKKLLCGQPYSRQSFVFANGDSNKPGGPDKDEEEAATGAPKTPETEKKAEEESEPKPAVDINAVQSELSKMIMQAVGTASSAIQQTKRSEQENEELKSKLERLKNELITLSHIDASSRKRTKETLSSLIQENKISTEQAEEFLKYGPTSEEFEPALEKILEKLTENEKWEISKTIRAESYEVTKVEEDFALRMSELRDALVEVGDVIYAEAYRTRAIDEHSKYLGFELKEGQVLRYKATRRIVNPQTGNISEEPIFRTATIKKVFFGDVESTDIDGNERVVQDLTPSVVLTYEDEWEASDGTKFTLPTEYEDTEGEVMTASRLKVAVDERDMYEKIEDTGTAEEGLDNLSEVLGEEIKVGDKFEFHLPKMKGKKEENQSVIITGVRRERDPFFKHATTEDEVIAETMVYLDKEVKIGNQMKKKMTLGQFARWKRSVDAQKPITLDELRKKLKKENDERNSKYKKVRDETYPPIKAEEGETLFFDTDPKKVYQIVNATDEEIALDNGTKFTPASFFSWVKNNEVEKMSEKRDKERKDGLKKAEEAVKKMRREAGEDENIEDLYEKPEDEIPPAPSSSYVRQLWEETRWLSLGDMYLMGKEIGEFIKRILDRAQKGRVGAAGKHALTPIYGQLGADFQKQEQAAENESVNNFAEVYRQYGIDGLNQRLEAIARGGAGILLSQKKDELKAIITVMSEKGYIRWGDQVLWDALNALGSADNFISQFDEEQLERSIDALWGRDTYRDFRIKNNSSYDQAKSGHMEHARQLENDPTQKGGMKGRMQNMLQRHIKGEDINPAEYEAYLHFAIEAGKLTFEDKLYFLMMGLAAGHGRYPERTILDITRLNELEGKLCNRFPVLDYFTNNVQMVDPKTKEIIEGQPNKGYIRWIINEFIEQEKNKTVHEFGPDDFEWTQKFSHFIKTKMIEHPVVKIRLGQKSSSECTNWDHDDMHIFVPQMSEGQISRVTVQSGTKQQASVAGLLNSYTGFNEFTKLYVDEIQAGIQITDNEKKEETIKHNTDNLKNLLRSYIRMNAILQNRYQHDSGDYTRLSTQERGQLAVVDRSRSVQTHINEVGTFIDMLLSNMKEDLPASNYNELITTWNIVQSDAKSIANSRDRDRFKKNQQNAVDNIGDLLEKAMGTSLKKRGADDFAKMIANIQNSQAGGLVQGIKDAPKDRSEQEQLSKQLTELETFDEEP